MLADFDELILNCRNHKAKAYVAEAIASYKGGAFRASIVSTWIAVCFDIIEKIRELANAGDAEAEKHAGELEAARKADDLTRALKFERELLLVARDRFELISHIEFIDLERLQHDRNRCAHPSLVSEDEPFIPSAELARLHLRSAVTHLLQHPPVQGKAALENLLSTIISEYFPTEYDRASLRLSSGPLKKPRQSLVRNLISVLVKKILRDDLQYVECKRITVALSVVLKMHPVWSRSACIEKIPSVVQGLGDSRLDQVIVFLKDVSDMWQYFDAGSRQRVEMFVEALPTSLFEELAFLLDYAPLKSFALLRVRRSTPSEYNEALFFDLPPAIGDHFIQRILSASGEPAATDWIEQLTPHVGDLSTSQIEKLIVNSHGNGLLQQLEEFHEILLRLFRRKKVASQVESLMLEHGWGHLLL